MGLTRPRIWRPRSQVWPALAILAASLCQLSSPQLLPAQPLGDSFELSGTVALDQADSSIRSHFERVKAYLADRQWDEAVETLRQVMENSGQRMIEVASGHYINVRDYCQIQISTLPAEALELYRGRVDAEADRLYQDAIAARDSAGLLQVVEQYFCSSRGDDAILALGEMALETGDHGRARAYWEKLVETPPAAIDSDLYERVRNNAAVRPADDYARLDKWYYVRDKDLGYYELRPGAPDDEAAALLRFWNRVGVLPKRLAYPGTDLNLADVRARRVLASILEGSAKRAEIELASFTRLHPEARGRLAGREANYVQALGSLLAASRDWPPQPAGDDWPTFAGSPERNAIAPKSIEIQGGSVWPEVKLPKSTVSDPGGPLNFGYRPRRVAEDNNVPLSYYPVVSGRLALFNTQYEIFARDLATGQPAWEQLADQPLGQIYRSQDPQVDHHGRFVMLGAQRYTMTAQGELLFARMGSPVTTTAAELPLRGKPGYLVCLDLARQGKLLWELRPEENWAFEGAPVSDGSRAYVAMRRSEAAPQPQAHVACLDARTGRMLWRRYLCSAETRARGEVDECTHNLLTLAHGVLYCNTNLGAVAAISAANGHVKWITLYERDKSGDLNSSAAHYYRDLTPCVYDRGRVFAAPADSKQIVALDAETGLTLWESDSAEQATQLLGVGGDWLIAAGDGLWWFQVDGGKLVHQERSAGLKGYGRGLLLGDRVYWPSRERIHVYSQEVQRAGDAYTVQQYPPIELREGRGATGGNLVASQGYLLVAAAEQLFVFSENQPPVTPDTQPPEPGDPQASERKNAGTDLARKE